MRTEHLGALSKSIMGFERPNVESTPGFTSYGAALDELERLRDYAAVFFKHRSAAKCVCLRLITFTNNA